MSIKIFYSDGKNQFKDNTFSWQEWSAPFIISPDEIKSRLDAMSLVGRTVKNLRLMGICENYTEYELEEKAYCALPDDMSEEERQRLSDYENISDSLLLSRSAIVDSPFLIRFEDDDIFEICTGQGPEYRFSMNNIPWNIKADWYCENVDAEIMFEAFLGKRIVDVELTIVNKEIDSTSDDEIGSYVSRIVLWLEGDIGICISDAWFDWCEISCIDRSNEPLKLTFGELKRGLHNDSNI